MNENVKIVFGLLGGLAMFLYGMNNMSDALQKTAGEKMKSILGFLTKNPIMGALAGALVTAVLQSSSATTVMVIGFVSAGLMTLPQAISVIFGANIGTTMTAQLMAFKISDYIYPIIFVGFLLNFLCKKEKQKNIGLAILSFGILFEGIEIMGKVMKPLASSTIFIDLMGKVSDMPVLGVVLGAVMTIVVQSSSATIAVLQNFASQPAADGITSVIGLSGAIPILFGDNIGTTITAILASIGQSKNAKRTAIAHSIFNITGTIVFLFCIPLLSKFVVFISPKGNEIEVISRQIANAHTTFNVVCTLMWLPLIKIMVKIVKAIIRGDDKNLLPQEESIHLDSKVISHPMAALHLVSEDIEKVSNITISMIRDIKNRVLNNEKLEEQDQKYNIIKKHHEGISSYIHKLFASGNMTEKQTEQSSSLLFITDSIDRIAYISNEISSILIKIENNNKKLSDEAKQELGTCLNICKKLFDNVMVAVKEGKKEATISAVKHKNELKRLQKELNTAHLIRVKEKNCDESLSKDFTKIIYDIYRISDNCVNIALEATDNSLFAKIPNINSVEKIDKM